MTIVPEETIEHLDFEPESTGTLVGYIDRSGTTFIEALNGLTGSLSTTVEDLNRLGRVMREFCDAVMSIFGLDSLAEAREISEQSAAFLQRNPELWRAICECTPSRGELLTG